MVESRRTFIVCALAAMGHAQTLAHPGWRGNGIAAEAWWRRAAIVRLPPDTTFTRAMAGMDMMSAAGVDTLLLPDLLIDGQPAPGRMLPFAERFGSEDELDALLREVSARRMHVLLSAPLLRLAGDSGEVRFWMTRGVAGFNAGTLRHADFDTLHLLRAALDRYPGQRLILARFAQGEDAHLAAIFARAFHGPTLRVASINEAEDDGAPVASIGAVEIENPATTPMLHGLVPVLPMTTLETVTGREQTRKMIALQVDALRTRDGKR